MNEIFIGEPCIANASCSLPSLTVSAAVRLIPSPPALVLNRNTKMSFLKKRGKNMLGGKGIMQCGNREDFLKTI